MANNSRRKAAAIATVSASFPATDPEKATRVEQERVRLMELFDGADKNKLDFIRDTVKQLSWLAVSIHDLQSEVDEKGPVIPFRNGQNQDGLQANPACKLLIDFEKLYNTAFRALLPLVPDKEESSTFDPFEEYKPKPLTKEEQEEAYTQQMAELAQIRLEIASKKHGSE